MTEHLDDNTLDGIRGIIREELGRALKPGGTHDAPAGEDAERILAGDIRYFRLPELLQAVSLARLTGRLTMSHAGQSVEIYLRRGNVAFATGEKRGGREQIGAVLMNMGKLTRAGLDKALETGAKTGVRLGRALIDGGHVKVDDMKAALYRQTERSVYKAMAWGDGRFWFELCGMPEFIEDIPVSLRVEDLILEGVRRIDEGRLISEKIPSLDLVFVRPAYSEEEIDNMRLKSDEQLALGLIDGKADLKGMLAASGLTEFNFLRAVYALYSAGIIRKRESAQRADRTQYL